MAKAVYAKNRKVCVVNRAVRVGTAGGVAGCVCGSQSACCINGYTGCYPVPGSTAVRMVGVMTARATIPQFQQPPLIYNALYNFSGSPIVLAGPTPPGPCSLAAAESGPSFGSFQFQFRRSNPTARVDVPPYYGLTTSITFGSPFDPVGAVVFWEVDALLPSTTPTTHFRRRVSAGGAPGWNQIVQVPYATDPQPPCYAGLRMVDAFTATRTADGATLEASIDATMTLTGAARCVTDGPPPAILSDEAPPGMAIDSTGNLVPLWSMRGCCG